jgi:hypothetical protein
MMEQTEYEELNESELEQNTQSISRWRHGMTEDLMGVRLPPPRNPSKSGAWLNGAATELDKLDSGSIRLNPGGGKAWVAEIGSLSGNPKRPSGLGIGRLYRGICTRKISAGARTSHWVEWITRRTPAGGKNLVEENLSPGKSECMGNCGKARSGGNTKPAGAANTGSSGASENRGQQMKSRSGRQARAETGSALGEKNKTGSEIEEHPAAEKSTTETGDEKPANQKTMASDPQQRGARKMNRENHKWNLPKP